ncbi:MAG: enoyl-CoA hydratase/isomerase family protein [Xanthomonadales bacterium]|nr:enoyl-CoA hydratase/isomerase family protein [Xanthomonadales bacterium]MBK7145575.1 enoyl-CoA hydratase/isomerase family protein [Xanthomonadales bacterium]MCC6561272.1 enoyl-CoA hydratase/isomerase family protein [Xanthomonadales bacterium]
MTSSIRIERRGAIAELVLDRASVHNAFDDGLIAEMTLALQQLEQDDSVRALVLTGAGNTFSAGADLNWMRRMARASADENRRDALGLATLMRTLNFLGKPTIARVNGSAYGGGVGLIACCDHAIATPAAKFSLSEVKLGLVPAVISPYVVAAIGLRHARRLFVSGEVFDADYALRIGLVHELVAADELDAAVERALHFLAKGGPLAQREAKQLALRQAGMTLEVQHALDSENADLIARLRVSPEGQEGLGSFLDKRPPRWVNAT